MGLSSFRQPLDPTTRKKFESLASLAEFQVVGLAETGAPSFFREAGASFHLVRRPRLAVLRFARALFHAFRTARRLVRRRVVDVVVCEDPLMALAAVPLRGVARRAGLPLAVVTELHGDWEQALRSYVRVPRLLHLVLRRCAAFTLRRSDVVRTVSETLRERYRPQLAAGTPVVVFPTYTDFELFLDRSHGPRTPGGPLLFVGVLGPVKGIDVLIEAMARLVQDGHDVELVIVGDGPLREWLSAELTRRGLADRVHLKGALTPAEVRDELGKARVLVLPSRSEGLPRVVLEAMATGVPVVASRVGGLPELVQDGETGLLVEAGDVGALAGALRSLLADPPKAEEMGRRARAWVQGRFSTAAYVDGYAEMLAAARARRR